MNESNGDDAARVGLTERVPAFLIDAVMCGYILFMSVLGSAKNSEDPSTSLTVFLFYFLIATLVVPIGMAYGGTIGQRIVGLRIVNVATGARPGIVRGFVRWFVALASGLLLFAGFWPMLRGRPGWHDRIAGTMLVRAKKAGPTAPPAALS